MRKSQVTESEASLLRSDLTFYDWGMLERVRKCKTIQFGKRVLEIPVSRYCNKGLFTVPWTAKHFAEVRAEPEEIAFRIRVGRGSLAMTYVTYQAMLKRFSNMAGLGEWEFTSHSLRWGGETYLAMCGASIEEIKVRGDWASETVYPYLKTALHVRIINDIVTIGRDDLAVVWVRAQGVLVWLFWLCHEPSQINGDYPSTAYCLVLYVIA